MFFWVKYGFGTKFFSIAMCTCMYMGFHKLAV